jgi:hypothetical protein
LDFSFWFIFLFQNLLFQTTYSATNQTSNVLTSKQKATEQEVRALEAIAAVFVAGRDKTDEVLNSVGFNDEVVKNISGFKNWPSLRKIETAYLSAVEAGKMASGGNEKEGIKEGNRFIQAISLEIAQHHTAAIRHHPDLQDHFSQTSDNQGKINFTPLTQEPDGVKDIHIQKVIIAIERHISNVPGGMETAMMACCKLDKGTIYEILRASPSNKEALISAIEKSPIPPQKKEKMIRLVRNIAEATHAVFYESALEPYLNEIDAELGQPSGIAKRGIETPQTTLENITKEDVGKVKNIIDDVGKRAQIDAAIMAAMLSSKSAGQNPPPPPKTTPGNSPTTQPPNPNNPPPAPSPNKDGAIAEQIMPNIINGQDNTLSGTAGAAGGSPITFEKNLERFKNVTNSIEQPKGLPKFSFQSMRMGRGGFGGVVFGSPVDGKKVGKPTQLFWVYDVKTSSPNDDWGHFDIVLGKNTVVSTRRFHSADAYAAYEIITGRKGVFDPLDVSHGEGVGLASVPWGEEPAMVVHPAIYGLAIGDAAAMADAIGYKMSPEVFVQHLEKVKTPAQIIEKAKEWRLAGSGFYKIIDTPFFVKNNGSIIRVVRSDKTKYDDRLKELAFLDFQAFDGDYNPLPSESLPFYEVLPALTTAFPAFERLNSFSEIMGLMRWASASKAKINPPERPKLQAAKLYIHELPNGEIKQFETESQITAEMLADVQKNAIELKTALKKDGAPNFVLACVDEIAAVKGDLIRIDLAEIEFKRQTKLTFEQRQHISDKFQDIRKEHSTSLKGCDTKVDMLNLGLDKTSVDRLSKLRENLKVAEDKYRKSREAIYEAEQNLPTLEQQIDQLPEAKKKLVKAAQKRLDEAEKKYWKARIPTAEAAAAIKDSEAAEKQLRDLIPPPDRAAVDSALQVAKNDREAADVARNAMDEMEKKLTPIWLEKNWSAIIHFLPNF